MDSGVKRKRDINPRENANIFSILSFSYVFNAMRKGFKRDLIDEDIYEVLESYKSDKLGNRLDKLWKLELKKKRPWIIRPLVKMFGMEYMFISSIMLVVFTCLTLVTPMLMGKVVSYYVPNTTTTRNDAIVYSTILVTITFIVRFLDHTLLLCLQQIFLKVRIACTSLIYRKCLKLNLNTTSQFSTGMALTIMTKDLNSFDIGLDFLSLVINNVVHMSIMFVMTYLELGISAVIAVTFLLLLYPLYGYIGYILSKLRIKTGKCTDKRVRMTQEILTAIRIIKMYTWEVFFNKSVNSVRKDEVKTLRNLFYLNAVCSSIGQLASQVGLYICIISYTGFGNYITADKAFVAIGYFSTLKDMLSVEMPEGVIYLSDMQACIDRMTRFLMLDEVSPLKNVTYIDEVPGRILIKEVTIKTNDNFTLFDQINLEFKKGLTAITGNVGTGKSTILKLILGDVDISEGSVIVSGSLSYASQDPWIFPGTVRQNIIFGETFDVERYNKVIHVCALEPDLEVFPNGDLMYLTDKGWNLSRGQKNRINLARAIYKQADIYLLDDCLSAVDAHVAQHIFQRCIKEYLEEKVCVLVTQKHQILPDVDYVVLTGDSSILYQGSYENFHNFSNNFEETLVISQLPKKESSLENEDAKSEDSNVLNENSRLLPYTDVVENIYGETNEQGSVKLKVYFEYLRHGGGYLALAMLIILFILSQVASSWSDYFVSVWVDIQQQLSDHRFNETTNSEEYQHLEELHDVHLKRYSATILVTCVLVVIKSFASYIFACRASVNIHKIVLHKILNAKVIFFDNNLSGNVLNRFSRDLAIVDEKLPRVLFGVIRVTLNLFGVLFVISAVNWFFFFPSVIFLIILIIARHFYMPLGRSIKRLEGSARSPLIGYLNASLEGLTTIRASKIQDVLILEFDKHQDLYSSASFMNLSTQKGFGFYLDALALVYISVITMSFLFLKTESLAGEVGLALTQSFNLYGLLQGVVRQWADLENQMTSTERVLEYRNIDTEDKSGQKVLDWPKLGKITYNNVNLRYIPTASNVLNNITFVIEPNKKIGIVGRTGAGKSSLIATLFKLYDYEGSIIIDNRDIREIHADLVRSKISIIPQDPVLFSDSLRNNLDPNNEYTDQELWDVLDEVGIKSVVKSLDAEVIEGGSNFSIGQRQLICLARAMLKTNSILIMDEATANVDPKTDALITSTINKKFSNITIIMIAHRLNTVMDADKIIVMDKGRIIEYACPEELLADTNSKFYEMAKEAYLV